MLHVSSTTKLTVKEKIIGSILGIVLLLNGIGMITEVTWLLFGWP